MPPPTNNDEDFEELSDDPEENLRLQNELLKLKMQAEMGAEFGGEMADLPPEVEQQILQQVLRFHEAQSSGEMRTVGQQLGQEEWPPASSFSSPAELQEAFDVLEGMLTDARLHVGFLADYPLSLKWDFITQELMMKETFPIEALAALQFGVDGDADIAPDDTAAGDSADTALSEDPSMDFGDDDADDDETEDENSGALQGVGFMGFIYEEFHPNHTYTIERYALDTLREIFEGTIRPESAQLANPLITHAGARVTIEELTGKVARFHDLFAEVKSWHFLPLSTEWDTETDEEGAVTEGGGVVEGRIEYTVVTDDGEESEVTGPCKMFFQYREQYWEVVYFELHGFSWS